MNAYIRSLQLPVALLQGAFAVGLSAHEAWMRPGPNKTEAVALTNLWMSYTQTAMFLPMFSSATSLRYPKRLK